MELYTLVLSSVQCTCISIAILPATKSKILYVNMLPSSKVMLLNKLIYGNSLTFFFSFLSLPDSSLEKIKS